MPNDEEPLTPRGAAQAIERLEGTHAALERRTSGLTWMVWGLASPAIFLSYGFAGAAGLFEADTPFWVNVLWAPWVAMGILASIFLWRSAGLVIPLDRRAARRGGILMTALFFGVIFGAFALFHALEVRFAESAIVLAALGTVNVLVGSFGILCTDRTERALWVGVGVALAATAFALALAFGVDAHAAITVGAAAASALGYFGGGLFLATRG